MMYVAFKWLTALSFAMWLGLCSIDMYLAQYKTSIYLRTASQSYKVYKYANASILKDTEVPNVNENWDMRKKHKQSRLGLLHYATFVVGAFAALMYIKKTLFISYCTHKIGFKLRKTDLEKTVEHARVAMYNFWDVLRKKTCKYASRLLKQPENEQNVNLSLLKRIKDLVQDRKTMGQLLIKAIEENKIIRRQFQLEVVAKNRLLHHIHDTRNVMKENRSRYVDFQQLYLTTAKENYYLKNNINTLRTEKDEAEKKLVELINVVYRSKNSDLKAYCTRFIVHTRKNLLNSDVNAEINKFIQSNKPLIKVFGGEFGDKSHYVRKDPMAPRITEILENDGNLESFGSSGPKLRGLPGECVWTIKDKNGIIEKLYEYDYDMDVDNGDTIRRIREYSVYHDRDCLLDHTTLSSRPTCPSLSASATRIRLDIKAYSSQGFLTKVLLKNNLLPLPSTADTPSLSDKSEMFSLREVDATSINWKTIRKEGLDLDYAVAIPRTIANDILKELEKTLEYFKGDLAKITVFGKEYPLPRQQVAYGDPGITYKYSGKTIPALPWPAPVLALRSFLEKIKGIMYDFVLVNRYRNGNDHMGEHRDNEPDLDPTYPIASISFGQERPFVLKHKDARKSGPDKKHIDSVKIDLEHGSILFMNPPTNDIWYHSLPTRKKLLGIRINLTFRKMRSK